MSDNLKIGYWLISSFAFAILTKLINFTRKHLGRFVFLIIIYRITIFGMVHQSSNVAQYRKLKIKFIGEIKLIFMCFISFDNYINFKINEID